MSTVAIEKFLQTAYSDEKLAALLAHAEDGKLSYTSCCCFSGFVTAPHPYADRSSQWLNSEHYRQAQKLPGATAASLSFSNLGDTDADRRAALIPLIKAEIARRDALKEAHCPCGDTCPTCDPESALEAQQQAEECSNMNVFHRY